MVPLVEMIDGENRYSTTNELVDFLDRFGKEKLEPFIDQSFDELCEYMHARENLLHMDREAIAGAGIGSNGLGGFWMAKKRYAISVFDMEGRRYDKPKLKIMGLETQRSSTPIAVRSSLKTALEKMLMEGEEALQEYYKTARDTFANSHYLDLASKSRVQTLEKYAGPGDEPLPNVPYAVRGALAYRRATKDIKSAVPIFQGDEVNHLPLTVPNPFGSHVISWPAGEELPTQIRDEVLKYVDYQLAYEKAFLAPLEAFTKAAGISYKPKMNMNAFFA